MKTIPFVHKACGEVMHLVNEGQKLKKTLYFNCFGCGGQAVPFVKKLGK